MAPSVPELRVSHHLTGTSGKVMSVFRGVVILGTNNARYAHSRRILTHARHCLTNMTTAAIARRAFAARLLSPATFRPALAASDHRTRAMGVVTDHNLGKNLDDAIHKAEKAREDIWFRDHDLDALRDLYKKARKQARHWKMEGESVKTDAAELAELKKLVNGKLDQATMERLIDWKHHQ